MLVVPTPFTINGYTEELKLGKIGCGIVVGSWMLKNAFGPAGEFVKLFAMLTPISEPGAYTNPQPARSTVLELI